MVLVDATGDLGILEVAKDRGSAGIRIHAGEVVRRQREATLWIVNRCDVVEKEGAVRFVECSVLTAEYEGAEFETRMDVLEENFLVLEIEYTSDAPGGGDGFEEGRRGLVCVNARGREQADDAIRLYEAHRPLHEQGVEVDVAATEQGIVARGADQVREFVRLRLGRVEVGRQWIGLFAELLDGGAPRCCGWGASQLGGVVCEPLDLLQLDAIPRRVANNCVKAAFWLIALPVLPHARERGLPVQEVLAVREGLGIAPERGKTRPSRVAGIGQKVMHALWPPGQKRVRTGLLPAERRHQRPF